MKLARILWTAASFYILIILFFYVMVLNPPVESGPGRLEYILDNWSLYVFQFKGELMVGTLLCISSLIFAVYLKNAWFVLIAIGQLFYAIPFPFVIGSYPEATVKTAMAFSQAAHSMITVGMMLSLGGFIGLHWYSRVLPRWLHLTGFIISIVSFGTFAWAFAGQIEHIQAQKVMVLVALLYLINGIFAIRLNDDARKAFFHRK